MVQHKRSKKLESDSCMHLLCDDTGGEVFLLSVLNHSISFGGYDHKACSRCGD